MSRQMISRRGFLSALGASALVIGSGGLLAACSGTASSASSYDNTLKNEVEDLTVALLGKDIKIACILIARQEGLYEREKLAVNWQTTTGFDVGMPALSKGSIDVMPFGVIPSCTYIGQGDDLVMFGGTVAQGSEALTLRTNMDRYKTAADFKGAKIACFRMETGHMVMKGWLREQGLNVNQDDPNKDVTFMYLENSAAEQAAVENGEADMAFVNSGYGYVAMKSDKIAMAFQVGDFVKDFPCCRQTTNRNAFENKRSALIKFEIANLAAYAILQNDHDKTVADLVAYSGQPQAYVENVVYGSSTYKPAMIFEMDPYTDRCVDFYGTMIDNDDIKNPDKDHIKGNVDSSIYKAALDEMVARGQNADLYKKLLEDYAAHNTLGL